MKQTIVFGVTGGIAAFKVVDAVSSLKKDGQDVAVIMSQSAAKMLHPSNFEKLGVRVYAELFEEGFDYTENLKNRRVEHIEVADAASVLVIAPATANVIAKLAYGIADDYITTVALAVTCPIVLCPSMNVNMWHNPIVQQNLHLLKKRGFIILDPDAGQLACGYEGKGRLVDITKIKNAIEKILSNTKLLEGKKIIVTAGGTQEKIDDVRFITNKSSGKMGVALAEACHARGADVILLRATSSVSPRYLIKEELFETAEELKILIKKYVKTADVIFHAAAVSDFKTEEKLTGKLSSDKKISLNFIPQEKIITAIKQLNPQIKLIAFKAEYGLSEKELIAKAKQKLQDAHADVVIANEVGKEDRGFGADTNEVIIVVKNGAVKKIPLQSKQKVAEEIVETVI